MNALDLARAIAERLEMRKRLELEDEEYDMEVHEIADEIIAWISSE